MPNIDKEIEKLKTMLEFQMSQPRSKTKVNILKKLIFKLEKQRDKEQKLAKIYKLESQIKQIKYKLKGGDNA